MIRFNCNKHHIIFTVIATERRNIAVNFCIMEKATVVWKANVDEVCDLKQGKQVLANREEYFDDYNEETESWRMVSDKEQFAVSGRLHQKEMHCGLEVLPTKNEYIYNTK